jgi:hypothetical protein
VTPVLLDGSLALFGVGRSGDVRAAILDARSPRPVRWKTLGGRFTGPAAALPGRDEIELFALTKRGSVASASWNPYADSKVRWTPIGGQSIVFVFAGEDGKVPAGSRLALSMTSTSSPILRWPRNRRRRQGGRSERSSFLGKLALVWTISTLAHLSASLRCVSAGRSETSRRCKAAAFACVSPKTVEPGRRGDSPSGSACWPCRDGSRPHFRH